MNEEIIIENLKTLTLIEIFKLVKKIEDIFGVSASIPQATDFLVDKPSEKLEVIEEKDSFDVILIEAPADKRISILKIVRNITGLGLKESKEIVDNVPKTIKEAITKNESDIIKKDLEAAGAKILIK